MNMVRNNLGKILVLSLVVLAVPLVTLAANPCAASTGSGLGTPPSLGGCVSQIYLWAMGAAGILGLLVAIIGGYLVMTAGGNAAQASKGKSFLFSSLVGIAILLSAYLILSTINPDLVQFDVQFDRLSPPPTPPGAVTN